MDFIEESIKGDNLHGIVNELQNQGRVNIYLFKLLQWIESGDN